VASQTRSPVESRQTDRSRLDDPEFVIDDENKAKEHQQRKDEYLHWIFQVRPIKRENGDARGCFV
jgi:hypothetical protein